MTNGHRPRAGSVSLVALLLLATSSVVPAHGQAYDFTPLDAYFESAAAFFPNGVALVIIQDGQVIYEHSFHGFNDSEPIPIASSTKWMSGFIISTLVEDGVLDLDTRAGDWLPAFTQRPLKRVIILEQGFTHASGLPSQPAPNRDVSLTMQQAVEQIADIPLIGLPGNQLYYGGLGMKAVGLMAANASGTDWNTLAEQRLFTPLGMTDSDYFAFTDPPGTPTENPNVAGSIRTTLADYTRFLLLLDGRGAIACHRIVPASVIDRMFQDYNGPGFPIDRSPYMAYEEFAPGVGSFRTGLGCFIDPARVDPETGEIGWATSGGAFGTNAFIDFDRDIAGVMMTYTLQRWPNSEGDFYNPSSRAFIESVRPLIESIMPLACGPDLPGDLNRDCQIDETDAAPLLLNLTGPQAVQTRGPVIERSIQSRADSDCDGDIDLHDVAAFARQFGH